MRLETASAERDFERVRRETVAMGTRLVVTVEARSRAEAVGATESVMSEVARMERLLSTWSPESELSRLNRAAPGRSSSPSAELASLLARVETWSRRTGGAFEPGVGALVDVWDLRGRGRRPAPDELERALRASGSGAIRIDGRTGAVERVRAEAWIDAGAFGKGAALAAAGKVLSRSAVRGATLDFGGQILVHGSPPAPVGAWRIPVAHPTRRERAVAALHLASGSVATSGASERGIQVDGERLGHLLDPRTGSPVPAWGSVTVVHDDPLVADILATALFVMGPDRALDWARARPAVAVLVLEGRQGTPAARWSDAMTPLLARTPEPSGSPGPPGRPPSSPTQRTVNPGSRNPS